MSEPVESGSEPVDIGPSEPGGDNIGTSESGGPARGGGGRALLAAAALVPWLLAYGITGSWAVTRGARALAQHLPHIDAGYSRPVTPGGLLLVGVLLLAGFAVLLTVAMLLVVGSGGRRAWTGLLVAALLLVAGALWAGFAGHIDPGLWILLFFGLILAAVLAAVVRLTMPPGMSRATMVRP